MWTLEQSCQGGESATWVDWDNDGDLDVFVLAEYNDGDIQFWSSVYPNQSGIFGPPVAGFNSGYGGWAAFGDYDNDGDLDLAVSGDWPGFYNNYSGILRNDEGTFVSPGAGVFPATEYENFMAWGDYDNDGDLDILGSGGWVYRNDEGIFVDIQAGLAGGSSAAWGDYDNDGDLDILLGGSSPQVYRNDEGSFLDIDANLQSGSGEWGDYDNDGDLDIFLSGSGGTRVFRNIAPTPNTPPSAPSLSNIPSDVIVAL